MMDGGDEEGGGGGGARKGYDVRRLELKQKKGAKGRRAKAGGGAGPSDDGFKLDMDDARFSRLFSSADYAVDPNDPRFVRTHASEALLSEISRRHTEGREAAAVAPRRQPPGGGGGGGDGTLAALVSAVKRKGVRKEGKAAGSGAKRRERPL
mmetsp:Transcript_26740/g.85916  ORF Transcript_26740/g.85916 Transcript_26740/m.85916 type:complete len:152 (+) Transcript_26740:473-928(+)